MDFGKLSGVKDVIAAGKAKVNAELSSRGLKLGGSLQQRAERLWRLHSVPFAEIPLKELSKAVRKRAAGGKRPQRPPDLEAEAAARQEVRQAKLRRRQERLEAQQPRCPSPPQEDGRQIVQGYKFEVDELDCAETPPEAYEDLAPALRAIAERLGKTPSELRIYDPYFCAGAVVRRLERLGFPRVHNENEDCYAVWAAGDVPAHDVIVTNPPFSGDHLRRLLEFVGSTGKPWFLLMPNYVYAREYWRVLCDGVRRAVAAEVGGAAGKQAPSKPFFIVPRRRYGFFVPKGMGKQGSAGGKKRTNVGPRGARTSPFITFWHCWGGSSATSQAIVEASRAAQRRADHKPRSKPVRLPPGVTPATQAAAAAAAECGDQAEGNSPGNEEGGGEGAGIAGSGGVEADEPAQPEVADSVPEPRKSHGCTVVLRSGDLPGGVRDRFHVDDA